MLVSQRCISIYTNFSIPDCREQLTTQSASRLKGLGTTILHIQEVCILLRLKVNRT